MGLPLYDCAVRTSVVASGGAMVQLVPEAAAIGTGRACRIRQVAISNTTATGFGVGGVSFWTGSGWYSVWGVMPVCGGSTGFAANRLSLAVSFASSVF